MSIQSGAPFELKQGQGPANGYAVIDYPGSLRYVCTRCDVVEELKTGVYMVKYSNARQFIQYADACGYDVFVPGRMRKVMV